MVERRKNAVKRGRWAEGPKWVVVEVERENAAGGGWVVRETINTIADSLRGSYI